MEGEEQVAPAPAGTGASLADPRGRRRAADGPARRRRRSRSGGCPSARSSIHDPGASRRHAQIRQQDGGWTLIDLGSTNGTQLNGQTVQQRELADGDRITIGTTVLEFREGRPMTPFALSAIKYGLLVLVYLFIWRAMRRVVPGRRARSRRRAAPEQERAAATAGHAADGRRSSSCTSRTARSRARSSSRPSMTWAARPSARSCWTTRTPRSSTRACSARTGVVRRGPRLDERHVRERPEAGRAGAWCSPGDKIRVGTTMLELQR